MPFKITNEAANEKCNAVKTLLAAGKIRILTGAAPANADAAETGTLLAELTMGSPAFGAPASGVMALSAALGPVVAVATGTAGYFRACKTAGAASPVAQGTVTASGGGGDMIINSVSIQSGADVTVNSWQYTQGKG